jgi:hypothetical protein
MHGLVVFALFAAAGSSTAGLKPRLHAGLCVGPIFSRDIASLQAKASIADAALASKIRHLIEAAVSDDAKDSTAADVQKIFADRGVPTTAMVGVEGAENFAVLAAYHQPMAFTKEVLAALERIPSQVPAMALAFLRARVKQKQIEVSIKEPYADPALAARLDNLFVQDQARRGERFDAAKMREIDERTGVEVRAIFKHHGVPTAAMVGPEGARWFVVLVLHQPPDLRREVLPKLRENVERGEADPADYAMMFDRAQVDEGKLQQYGANFSCGPDGTLAPSPIEDLPHLDARRAEIGLLPMRLYAKLLKQSMPKDFCKGVTAPPPQED